jgi:hypothetical protein
VPTKFRFIWLLGFRGEDLLEITRKKELPMMAMFVNRSGRNEVLQGMAVGFFLCVCYTVNRILKANIFTCFIQYLYNWYTLYFGINESLMMLWLPNLSLASQVSPAHNKQFCKGPNRNTSEFSTSVNTSCRCKIWLVLLRNEFSPGTLLSKKYRTAWVAIL